MIGMGVTKPGHVRFETSGWNVTQASVGWGAGDKDEQVGPLEATDDNSWPIGEFAGGSPAGDAGSPPGGAEL